MPDDAIRRIPILIAGEIRAQPAQVVAAIALLDEGATVPFIARYRKEVTGGLDDTQLRDLAERLIYLREFEARRAAILASIREQGKMTEDLERALTRAVTKSEIEDIYLPFKPKRRSRAMIARENGLEPLLMAILADRAAHRIARLVYLDAFVPRNGQSLLDLGSPARRNVQPGDWRVAPNPPPPDTPASDIEWITPRRVTHPVKCMQQKIRLTGAVEKLPRSYIYCTRPAQGDGFRQFADRAKTEKGWQYLEIDASHNPHVTNPGTLARMLDRIATGRWPVPVKASR